MTPADRCRKSAWILPYKRQNVSLFRARKEYTDGVPVHPRCSPDESMPDIRPSAVRQPVSGQSDYRQGKVSRHISPHLCHRCRPSSLIGLRNRRIHGLSPAIRYPGAIFILLISTSDTSQAIAPTSFQAYTRTPAQAIMPIVPSILTTTQQASDHRSGITPDAFRSMYQVAVAVLSNTFSPYRERWNEGF